MSLWEGMDFIQKAVSGYSVCSLPKEKCPLTLGDRSGGR